MIEVFRGEIIDNKFIDRLSFFSEMEIDFQSLFLLSLLQNNFEISG